MVKATQSLINYKDHIVKLWGQAMVIQKMLSVDINKETKKTLDYLFEKKDGEVYTFYSKHSASEVENWKRRIDEGEIWVDVDFNKKIIISTFSQPPWEKTKKLKQENVPASTKVQEIIIRGDFNVRYDEGTLYIESIKDKGNK